MPFVIRTILALVIFISCPAIANLKALETPITYIRIHQVSLQLIDNACGSDITLTKVKLNEINQAALAKAQRSYPELVTQLTNPDEVMAKAQQATQPLIESDCAPDYLEYLHMVIMESLDEHLSDLSY